MKITAFTLGFLAAAASAAPAADTASGNSACAKTLALKITNIYENGDTNFHYDYCENIKDGRGFTSGISGFCTGTADAWEVVQQYHKLTGGKDSFSKYDGVLKKYAQSGSDSTSGLDGYCSVWSKLGKSDAKFRNAQDAIRDSMYYNPSQKLADQLGLKLSISRAQLYDCGIQHGTGSDADGLAGLIKTTNASFKADAKGSSGSTLKIKRPQRRRGRLADKVPAGAHQRPALPEGEGERLGRMEGDAVPRKVVPVRSQQEAVQLDQVGAGPRQRWQACHSLVLNIHLYSLQWHIYRISC
ncbi:lysozyme-like protein [Linderina pennispora]|uniref:Lysozyme-like protein n=1 Tax=Linderina pennispora TaxID=61395 RepID=A0A1Y1WGJ7_9FUNG|nr:lysozyme-like protein [Linderina pennispora]ORX72356.1 lysozyme-like protein [Linderina pennispora]